MPPLNILVSSTRQWNPGDEFIRYGVKNLLFKVTGTDHNWLLWNRNPDLMTRFWEDSRLRPDFLSNSMRSPSLDIVDLVVFAGTPEWTGGVVDPIYRELLQYPDKPVLVLGVGSGGPNLRLEPYQREVLRRENVFVSTRSKELAQEINQNLEMEKALALPCPALLCSKQTSQDTPPSQKIGLILQSSSVINQAIDEELVQRALRYLERNQSKKIEIICLYIDEFMRFSRLCKSTGVRYSYEPQEYLSLFSEYSAIVATRLHGAIASLSCGVPAALISKNNYRLESAQRMYGDQLPMLPIEEALDWAIQLSPSEVEQKRKSIFQFKAGLHNQYSELLADFFGKYVFHPKKQIS